MKNSKKRGFTLVELVIVIAVIAILAAVLIPTFVGVIDNANNSADTQLATNMNTVMVTNLDGDATATAENMRKYLKDNGITEFETKHKDNIVVYNKSAKQFEVLKLNKSTNIVASSAAVGGYRTVADKDGIEVDFAAYSAEEIFKGYTIVSTGGNELSSGLYALHNFESAPTESTDILKGAYSINENITNALIPIISETLFVDKSGEMFRLNSDSSGNVIAAESSAPIKRVVFNEECTTLSLANLAQAAEGSDGIMVVLPTTLTEVNAEGMEDKSLSSVTFAGNTEILNSLEDTNLYGAQSSTQNLDEIHDQFADGSIDLSKQTEFSVSQTQTGDFCYSDLSLAMAYAYQSALLSGASRMVRVLDSITVGGDVTVPQNVTLLLPYGADDTGDIHSVKIDMLGQYNKNVVGNFYNEPFAAVTPDSAYVAVTVAEGVKIDVEGTLIVGGKLQGRSSSAASSSVIGNLYAALELKDNATLAIKNNGKLSCLGFVFGNGTIAAENGSKVVEAFSMPGWPGGTAAKNLQGTIFPLNQYALTNIEAHLKVFSGATYSARAIVTASKFGMNVCGDVEIQFVSSGDMSLVKFNGSNESDYVEKSIDNKTGRISLDLHGDISMNNIVMDFSGNYLAEMAGFKEFSTQGKQVPIPGCFSINVCEGSDVKIAENVQVKLLPGAQLNVQKNAKLTLQANSAIYAYGDGNADYGTTGWSNWQDKVKDGCTYPVSEASKIYRTAVTLDYSATTPAKTTIDGEVVVMTGAVFAVNAENTADGAMIKFEEGSSVSGSINEATDENNTKPVTLSAKGKTEDGSVAEFAVGTYVSENGVWKKAEEVAE